MWRRQPACIVQFQKECLGAVPSQPLHLLVNAYLSPPSCQPLALTTSTAAQQSADASCLQFFDQLAAGELEGRPDAWSYSAMALAYRRGEQYTLVLDTYQEMLRGNMPVYHDVYYGVLESCERMGLWQEGRDTLRQMQV